MNTTTPAEARKSVQEGNIVWGNARVALDRAAYETMLASDFYVLLRGQRLSRHDFIERVSKHPPDLRLTRFDATALTVQAVGDAWVSMILEKLEYRRQSTGGTDYILAITRDGWRLSNGGWQILYSELIGEERWRDGEHPPMADW